MGLNCTVSIKHYAHYQDNPGHVSRLDATSEHYLTKRNMNSMSQPILAYKASDQALFHY
jgi:hypothetical protein